MNENVLARNARFAREIEKLRASNVPSNFHTHCTYCDGRDEPEKIVLEAIRLGCPALGFSSHAPVAFFEKSEGETLEEAKTRFENHMAEYRACICRLKEKYAPQIRIFVGIEQDYYSETSCDEYEYVIGSVHLIPCKSGFMPVDNDRADFERHVRENFDGDYYAAAETYYDLVAQIYERTHCSIIGHFDLITKYNEGGRLFDTAHPRYRAAAEKALDALLKTPAIFEWNFGAIPRGARKTPYLENWMLEKIKAAGKAPLRTSDCHNLNALLFGLGEG